MIYQPFIENDSEDAAATICADCGRTIYSGELSYSILGEHVCADCVSSSGRIAGDNILEDIEYLSETYYPQYKEHLFDFGKSNFEGR